MLGTESHAFNITTPECVEHDCMIDDSAVHLVTNSSEIKIERR